MRAWRGTGEKEGIPKDGTVGAQAHGPTWRIGQSGHRLKADSGLVMLKAAGWRGTKTCWIIG